MWRGDTKAKDGLYLTRDPMQKELSEIFNSVSLLDTLTVKRGVNGEKTFYIYRVSDSISKKGQK
jgi:hypothetical protein